jgi:acyl carrier protein
MSAREEHIFGQIGAILKQILASKGRELPALDNGTVLLGRELGIDSLDLAMLVRELEVTTGFDPFQRGFIEFRTVGELARLYVR